MNWRRVVGELLTFHPAEVVLDMPLVQAYAILDFERAKERRQEKILLEFLKALVSNVG